MPASHEAIVQVTDITHTYKKVRALDAVSLEIPYGRMVGLLGADGVGKSTLLGLIAGARKLQSGQLEVLSGDMASAKHRRQVGPRIAFMPQGLGKNLYQDLSIAENLNFFGTLYGQNRREREDRINRLTRATGLHPFLDRPAGKLSGGMKQKLGLCCALIHDPELLILDEPTTGVDPLSRRQFWELIDSIRTDRPGMSVLVSTAYMDEADAFDWLVAMHDGRILDTGSPQEIKDKTGTKDLESAFVGLLAGDGAGERSGLEIPPLDVQDGPPAIVAKGLTRRFGDFTAVDNVSFEIRRGEIFGFLGSNGCGKTTTMKMLTGLLPASEGEASLFGKPVDAEDLQTRTRVGFKSQAFSLYGELTVQQNFDLHARLFDLPYDKAANRIVLLAERFDLSDQLDAKARDLPLGVRQRLSLAIAVLHEPDMLILDEPTSGVDPAARDGFWELLVELSRKDKVTIFISTHFMNEAMRCDRISLMHAGRVLVYDEPEHLVQAKGTDTLEEAFVSYIEEAIDETAKSPDPEPATPVSATNIIVSHGPQAAPMASPTQGFSPQRLLAYSSREMMEVMRDPIRLAFAFLGSMILLVIMSYGISMDVENLKFAAFDQDRTPQSRAYLRTFAGSRYFSAEPEITSAEDLDRRLKSGSITLAIEIPPNFGRDLKRGSVPTVSAWVDGSNTTRAGTLVNYVSGAHSSYLTAVMREAGVDPDSFANMTFEPRYQYNPAFESIYAIGPSIPAMLLLLFPAILMAVSVAREKEIGTITNFYVTPTTRLEFLLGKQLPYIAIAMANFVILTLLVIFVLGVPLKGSLLALTCGALLYAASSTGYGLLISTLTNSQVAAVFAGAILSMMPTMQFSGMIQPVSTLEGGARIIGQFWPTTYYMHLSVGAFTKGLGFPALSGDLFALALFTPVFVGVAALLLKKQEA